MIDQDALTPEELQKMIEDSEFYKELLHEFEEIHGNSKDLDNNSGDEQ